MARFTKGEGEGKGGCVTSFCDRPAVDVEGTSYLLARNCVKDALTKMNWEQADVLRYICIVESLDPKCFRVLPVKGRDFRISTKTLLQFALYGVYSQCDCI